MRVRGHGVEDGDARQRVIPVHDDESVCLRAQHSRMHLCVLAHNEDGPVLTCVGGQESAAWLTEARVSRAPSTVLVRCVAELADGGYCKWPDIVVARLPKFALQVASVLMAGTMRVTQRPRMRR